MRRDQHTRLLDKSGQPLSPHVEDALTSLISRLQRTSPVFLDDSVMTDVLEEAGRRITRCEQRAGPIKNLRGYAWVAVRSVATSWLRRGRGRLAQETLGTVDGESALQAVPAHVGTPEQMEHRILLRQILAQLTPEERVMWLWKHAGFSTEQIAARRGTSIGAINSRHWRTKEKVRSLLGVHNSQSRRDQSGPLSGL